MLKLELSVLMIRRTAHRGHLHRIFPNVNTETAKYTWPCKLGLVNLHLQRGSGVPQMLTRLNKGGSGKSWQSLSLSYYQPNDSCIHRGV